jgi:CRISPR-associated endonuclease Csn1
MPNRLREEYILGIDLGSNSLGWAIIGLIDDEPAQLICAGTRVFDAGMQGDIQSGREESRNLKRREARLHRRLLWRRRRRLTKLFNLLRRSGLLPAAPETVSNAMGNVHRHPLLPDQLQDYFNNLDKDIVSSEWFKSKAISGLFREPEHTMPYILRASALVEPLEPHFLGRALYHLAQRRGFLSNRKHTAKKNDDEGAVKEGIAELRKAIQEKQARTLGEYLCHLNPAVERIRCRWTARYMYENEFSAIWDAQASHRPDLLTPDRKKQIYDAIFYQRPLWFDPETIGKCELEPSERRAPAHLPTSQRFRLLQTVNNLRVLPPDDIEMTLTPADRKKVIDDLETNGDRTFKQIFKLLKLEKTYAFNLERGGEKRIKGNRTNSDFCKVFGDRWLAMSPERRDRAVEYVHSFQNAAKLKSAAKKHFQIDDEAAKHLAEISLEPDYMNLSRKAIEKLLPLLEEGLTYGEARKIAYPESFQSGEPKPVLPPAEMALAEIRNPAVMRSLTELRKVINAIIRRYGKPRYVHVELARDLKKSKKQRQAISEKNRRNEKSRSDAVMRIMAEADIAEPRPDDIRKFLLAEECHWMCPYTGKSISVRSLFGPEPQFDIEHIIPFSRSMDNSFQNLTLCYVPENRSVKGNKTPHQAYHANSEQYEAMLDRVRKFGGDRQTLAAKLKRFMMNDDELELFLEDFRNRQLNDTAYATSIAAKYLGLLYGGVIDPDGRRRVQSTSGQATSYFRSLWKLNSILNDGPTTNGGAVLKSREDHRHHAVDAVVIGLTDAAVIKRLCDAAQRAPLEHRRRFASLEAPWPNFVDSVRTEIGKIIVSHRVSKKVSGSLHEESIYSRPAGENGEVRIRKPLASLTKPEVEKIADDGVKKLVQRKLDELGETEPKKAFSNPENLPRFPSSGVIIKKVRISKAVPTYALGEGRIARRVTSESNHHVEIYAEIDEHGNEGKWDGEVVSMSDAYQRLKAGKPIVQREFAPLARFKFSLAPGEVIECKDKGEQKLLVVRSVTGLSAGQIVIGLAPVNDARRKGEMQKCRDWVWKVPNSLRESHARKVAICPLGEVTEAHD